MAWPGDYVLTDHDAPDDRGQPLRIVMVCTGNICRSPLAEHLLLSEVRQLSAMFEVTSAGTHAMLEGEVPNEIRELLHSYGVGLFAHTPRQLTEKIALDADVILTATREHRKFVVSLAPRTATNAFTMKQFSRLLTGYVQLVEAGDLKPAESPQQLIRELANIRGLVLPADTPEDDDIADPYLGNAEKYAVAGNDIRAALSLFTQVF